MEISVRGRHLDLSEPLKAYAVRRLGFAADAFESRIHGIGVCVTDVNGPRGGVDKHCVIAVLLRPTGRVVVHAADGDAYSAIDRAAARVRAVLVRTVNRARRSRRRSQHSRQGY